MLQYTLLQDAPRKRRKLQPFHAPRMVPHCGPMRQALTKRAREPPQRRPTKGGGRVRGREAQARLSQLASQSTSMAPAGGERPKRSDHGSHPKAHPWRQERAGLRQRLAWSCSLLRPYLKAFIPQARGPVCPLVSVAARALQHPSPQLTVKHPWQAGSRLQIRSPLSQSLAGMPSAHSSTALSTSVPSHGAARQVSGSMFTTATCAGAL